MSLEKRINAFVQLGIFLKQFENSTKNTVVTTINNKFYKEFDELIARQKALNGWFTRENVINSISAIANLLSKNNLQEWILNYLIKEDVDKNIGVIMAGNIPLVGFHDFLCVLITGNTIQAKLSSVDSTLIQTVAEILIFIDPSFKNKIYFVERLNNFDAVIATGSDNSARYFYQYFSTYPHIIRKTRNSVAIIHSDDTIDDLRMLGKDVFQYFGLGCRSISKVYLPEGYKIDAVFEAFYDDYQNIIENNKYANNYDYNKAVYLLGNNKILDNGFLLLKEESSLTSPVGVLHYEYYNALEELENKLNKQKEEIQCIVASKNTAINTLTFGQSQHPSLTDYSDGVDVIKFLLQLM